MEWQLVALLTFTGTIMLFAFGSVLSSIFIVWLDKRIEKVTRQMRENDNDL